MRKETAAVHAGTYHEKENQPVNSPVFTSSTAYYTHLGECQYPRYYNMPGQDIITAKLAALEGVETGMVFSSGMAAIAAILSGLFRAGDHVIFQNDIYGGTYYFVQKELPKLGIEFTFTTIEDKSSLQSALQPNTRGIYIETPSNPLLKITDLALIADFARSKGLISIIDNTFASPVNQNPAEFGIDVIMHSGTKYLGGHSDLIFGVALSSKEMISRLREHAINFGPCLNGATCALIERSLKTLPVRIDRHNFNAQWLAGQLLELPFVDKVYYPGLTSHPGHAIASQQMKGFGGVLSFEPAFDREQLISFMENLRIITPAVSLGGVESLISSPLYTSHVKVGPEVRKQMGIADNLLRLSVGIENHEDLLQDIREAADKVFKRSSRPAEAARQV